MTLDLDRYFARIGWSDPVPATLHTVAGLLRAHMMTIPFENFDVLLGTSPSLELDALQAKLVDRMRGGYCYEHSTLFAAVLEQLGFSIKRHSARVTTVTPKHLAPRTHMLLSVDLPEGTFVLDPGFGGPAPLVPVPVDGTVVGDHQLVRDPAGEYTLKVSTPERVMDAWVTTLTPELPIDFVLANHFTSTHPTSPFTRRILARAFARNGKVTVANREVTRYGSGSPVTSQLADRAALHDLLVADFGFDLDVANLRIPSIPDW